MQAVEYSKSFITSVVVGKDVVPRIGLHQMEALRADLINAIKRSVDPKWKTIACTMICCCCGPEPTSVVEMESHDSNVVVYEQVISKWIMLKCCIFDFCFLLFHISKEQLLGRQALIPMIVQ